MGNTKKKGWVTDRDLNKKENQNIAITKTKDGFLIHADFGSITYSTRELAADCLVRHGYNPDRIFDREGDYQV